MQLPIRHAIAGILGLLLLLGSPVGDALAQKKKGSSVKSRQAELEQLRTEIKRFEQRLRESEKRERSTLQRLDDYDRQTSLIRSLVQRLSEDIAQNQKEIAVAQLNLSTAENELRLLKKEYSRTVLNMYRRGRTHDTELLLSSGSINELFIRSKYLKAYSERARMDAEEIRLRKEKIELQKMLLEDKLAEQQGTIRERRAEEQALQRKQQEHRQLLSQVRQDKQSYETQLRRKQEAAQRVERIIADLIERERRKLEAEQKAAASKSSKGGKSGKGVKQPEVRELPTVPISNTAFGRLRGRLPWPVAQGAVVGFFGENVNPTLGTVTISPGIDIASPPGSPVRSVADGVVKVRNFIAGYGNLLIVSHGEGFYTVYAHLSAVSVGEGQKVRAGETIGRSGEGISGPRLHFELWWKRQKQNPLNWLSPR